MTTRLLPWIDINYLFCECLSTNTGAVHLLEDNQDKIDWVWLSQPQCSSILTSMD